jgi:SET domain-containing protein
MYRPLPIEITVGKSNIQGNGLIAVCDITANTELGISHIKDNRFLDGYIRTPLGGFINHSENPNCCVYEVNDVLKIKTIKNILKGEELTIYYTLYRVK